MIKYISNFKKFKYIKIVYLQAIMGLGTTLLIKHLPRELSTADREELLKIAGAAAVRVMLDDGKMKFCAFATFRTKDDAKAALSMLHQKEILGITFSYRILERETYQLNTSHK